MKYVSKRGQGFEINDDVAEALGLQAEWEEWDGDQYESSFMDEFDGLFSVTPERLVAFEVERGGEISHVEGFEEGVTYLIFDAKESGEEWDALLDKLADIGVDVVEGSWTQLV